MKVTVHEPLELEVIASRLEFPEGPVILDDGSVLAVDIEHGAVIRADGGDVTVVASPGGGPNGLALRSRSSAVVANNGGFFWTTVNGASIPIDPTTHTNEPQDFTGGWMEEIDLTTCEITPLQTEFLGRPVKGPNDLVFDGVAGMSGAISQRASRPTSSSMTPRRWMASR